MKTTIIDIAQCAGLSTATVDRVLNRRPGASAASRQRVHEAARKLNYLPTFDSVTLPSKPAHLAFIIPIGKNSFLAGLAKHIEDYASRIPLVASCTVHRLSWMVSACARARFAGGNPSIIRPMSSTIRWPINCRPCSTAAAR